MTKQGRDDFKEQVKRQLAMRVCYQCSKCSSQTVGPSSSVGTTNIGVAAHITAASQGGPRYDGNMSLEDRSDISNGIWLCQSCAKHIDNDVARFTVDCLSRLKKKAEDKAYHALPGDSGLADQDDDHDILIQAYRCLEFSEDWRSSDGEEKCFYCTSRPEFTIREKDSPFKPFHEEWLNSFVKPSASIYPLIVFWHGTPIYNTFFVKCDESRYYLPMPQKDNTGGFFIKKKSIAYRIARLYRQHYPLDSTLSRCKITLRD